MSVIQVNNFTKFKVDRRHLERLAGRILKGERRKFDLSISLVSSGEIKKLNKKYRKIAKPTDVLSFTFRESGEIVLCPQVIKRNAKKYGEEEKREMARVLVHGILHVLGYDHEKSKREADKMASKEKKYLFS